MKLSILICTLPERKEHLGRLMESLSFQMCDTVEILVDARDRNIPTGQKRNELIDRATGEYFCFIDDDDDIAGDYVASILGALEEGPDVVTFEGTMTTNGMSAVHWIIKLGEKYEARTDPDGITRYYRFPNHLTAMKKELVKGFRFDSIWQGEDYKWALRIHNAGVLKTSRHIGKRLYHYKFITGK